jgi:hypothetical protein
MIDAMARDGGSDPLERVDRPLVPDVARIERRGRLEQQDLGLFLGDRPMLDPAWDDEELAFLQPDLAIPEVHPESALHDQEQLILVLMMVPDELALEFHQLDTLAVELAHDPRLPLVGDLVELLREIHLLDCGHWRGLQAPRAANSASFTGRVSRRFVGQFGDERGVLGRCQAPIEHGEDRSGVASQERRRIEP